jgi:MFS family permease
MSARPAAAPEPSVAANFNRWLIPVAAIALHLCIGSVYAWSGFNLPIKEIYKLHGVTPHWLFLPPYATFSTALVMLGLSAAFGGPWVERHGPRKAALTAALCFCSGLVGGGLGLKFGLPWLVFLGHGVLSGIGCGIGYIAPMSTSVKWFPDRRGMATGLAVLGFGGGSIIAGKLNVFLMATFGGDKTVAGVSTTMFVLAALYFPVMIFGALILRSPSRDWKPSGWTPSPAKQALFAVENLSRNAAMRTPQFWLLWSMLFINITAGIGILSQAAPMMKDMFGKTAAEAGTMIALIGFFNAGGRFFWASLSDYVGRKPVYLAFFALQTLLFFFIPVFGATNQWLAFQIVTLTIFTMYGGGFATIPAFLADLFGKENVGAIHGAVLTAWSAAAVAGPVIITEISNRNRAAGVAPTHLYDASLHLVCGLLAVGFTLTLLVRPLRKRSSDAAPSLTLESAFAEAGGGD